MARVRLVQLVGPGGRRVAVVEGVRLHLLKEHESVWALAQSALKNGVSLVEIREVLLQVAIYCGVPAAVDSFRIAREALQEVGAIKK